MVHALAHSPRLQAGHLQERPDATRIAAMSGAISINAIAMLLLLMPISAPPSGCIAGHESNADLGAPGKETGRSCRLCRYNRTPFWKKMQLPYAVATANQRGATDGPGHRRSRATRPRRRSVEQCESQHCRTGGRTFAAVRLEYAIAPPPAYPRMRSAARQGTVLLRVLVDVDGGRSTCRCSQQRPPRARRSRAKTRAEVGASGRRCRTVARCRRSDWCRWLSRCIEPAMTGPVRCNV